MEDSKIIQGNKLIAEFMGVKMGEPYMWRIGSTVPLTEEHLAYHESWDWLMPVVEKIETTEIHGLATASVCIEDTECEIKDYGTDSSSFAYEEGDTKIEAVWKACVAFIEWYNTQNQNQ